MFTLNKVHEFPSELSRCRLGAWVSATDTAVVRWTLTLASQRIHCALIPPEERGPGWDKVGILISCEDLALEVSDWASLTIPEQSVKVSQESSGFQICEWERLLGLRLHVRHVGGSTIEIVADGIAKTDSVHDLFHTSEVRFAVHTRATFDGVSIRVPAGVQDPVAYADAVLENLIPKYPHRNGELLQQMHNGTVVHTEVNFPVIEKL